MSSSTITQTLLLETLKIEDGVIHNLSYHQERCTRSRKKLYGSTDILQLENSIIAPSQGLYRCRVIYAHHIQSIEYIPYVPRNIDTLKIVSSTLTYDLKYANRRMLDTLLHQHPEADDILIEQDGYLTDTSIANIAFYDGQTWYTPTQPLLHGTMRQKLLDDGFLQTKQIQKEDLTQYSQVALMNAMIGFKIIKDIRILT